MKSPFSFVITVLLALAAGLTGCKMGVRSSYTGAQVASYVHPDMRVMQMCNSTACEHWPSGADLRIYCDGKLFATLKPKEDRAILFPASQFEFKVVAVDGKSGEELKTLAKTFDASPKLLPSWSVRWEAFMDPTASPPSSGS